MSRAAVCTGLMFLLAMSAAAQITQVDLQKYSRGVDFSAAILTKPVRVVSALPSTCSNNEVVLLSTAIPGQTLYACNSSNTWALEGTPVVPALPSSCVVGQLAFLSNSATTAGNNLYGCTAANTWTLEGPNSTPAVSALPALCTVGQMVFLANGRVPAGNNLYGCAATNTWTPEGPPPVISTLPSSCTLGETVFLSSTTAGNNLFGCTGTNTWTAESSMPTPVVSTLPVACTLGQLSFLLNGTTPAGSNLYGCTATNTWTLEGSNSTPVVSSLPAACTTGQVVFLSNGSTLAGNNLYGCTATNTWTAEASSSGTAGPAGSTSYAVAFSGQTTQTIPFSAHQFTSVFDVQCSSSTGPASIPWSAPGTDPIVVITPGLAFTGTCNVIGFGPANAGNTTQVNGMAPPLGQSYVGTNLSGQIVAAQSPGAVNSGAAKQMAYYAANGTTVSGTSSMTQDSMTGAITVSKDMLFNSIRPGVDLVALGADPTGVVAADAYFAAAQATFAGTSGGTIFLCGTFTLSSPPFVITQNGLTFDNNCGTSGSSYSSGTNLGGAVIESAATSSVPNPAAGPLLAIGAHTGTLATATYYIKTTLLNGFGETLASPSTSITTTGASKTIAVTYPSYQSGGWGFNIYCSTDNTNFYLVPDTNIFNGGANWGHPFLVGIGTSANPEVTTCASSGTTPPSSNTASHGATLIQVGSSTANITSGPTFRNITFYDPGQNLGGGVVVASAQRTRFEHCHWRYFYAGASNTPAGTLQYEEGGIALAIISAGNTSTSSTNYTYVEDPDFFDNQLSILSLGQDSLILGGTITPSTGQVGIDEPITGLSRTLGVHFATQGTGSLAYIVARGSSFVSHYGGTYADLKIESLERSSGPAIKLVAARGGLIDVGTCSGSSAAANACVQLDSGSWGNVIHIASQLTQCPYSDGSTCFNDPSSTGSTNGNSIQWGGTTPGMQTPWLKTGSSSNKDLAGNVTLSSGSGTYVFTGTYNTAPYCTATDTTAANAVKALATTSTLTLTGTGSDVITYQCIGAN